MVLEKPEWLLLWSGLAFGALYFERRIFSFVWLLWLKHEACLVFHLL